MPIHNYFVFDGKSSLDFGVGISGSGTFRRSHRRVERFTIPGRNGTLTISDGTFEDVEISYPAYFVEDFDRRYDALAAWLYSKQGMLRLEDTYHPEYFRLAEFVGDIEPDMGTLNRSGKFELRFNCDGRKFLKSGERVYEYTPDDVDRVSVIHPEYGRRVHIVNPTLYPAKPILVIPGIGIIKINDVTITFSGGDYEPPETVGPDPYHLRYALGGHGDAFDCDSYESYCIENTAISLNEIVTVEGGEPVLLPGENHIVAYLGTLQKTSSFAVVPRWYEV